MDDKSVHPGDPRHPRHLPELSRDEFNAQFLDDGNLTLTVWDADGVALVSLDEARALRDWLNKAIAIIAGLNDDGAASLAG